MKCRTSHAREKIRQWFKRQERDENIVHGRENLDRELKGIQTRYVAFNRKLNLARRAVKSGLDLVDTYTARRGGTESTASAGRGGYRSTPSVAASNLLIGEGEASFAGEPQAFGRLASRGSAMSGREALARAGIEPLVLEAKEGLALINGTQYMAGLGALSLLEGARLASLADVAGAMSLEALKGSKRPFDERLMRVRPHPGQADSAANLRRLLEGSAIMESHRDCGKVQDAYSLRCMPQVHGATRDALRWAADVVGREL
jgi:histidine ammonia-lyase